METIRKMDVKLSQRLERQDQHYWIDRLVLHERYEACLRLSLEDPDALAAESDTAYAGPAHEVPSYINKKELLDYMEAKLHKIVAAVPMNADPDGGAYVRAIRALTATVDFGDLCRKHRAKSALHPHCTGGARLWKLLFAFHSADVPHLRELTEWCAAGKHSTAPYMIRMRLSSHRDCSRLAMPLKC